MSDYSIQLKCGCWNWCRCTQRKLEEEARAEGFSVHHLKEGKEYFSCSSCGAIVASYQHHKLWHERLAVVINGANNRKEKSFSGPMDQ